MSIKILHINSFDLKGGASIAAFRLHSALREAGVDSHMLVQSSISQAPFISGRKTKHFGKRGLIAFIRVLLSYLPVFFYPRRKKTVFTTAFIPSAVKRKIRKIKPDLINLHWLGGGYLSVKDVAELGVPIVWTLHDMWPFTGGCHYDENCGRYKTGCGACPVLASHSESDISRWVLNRKIRDWKHLPAVIVSPSQWLSDCSRESLVFKELPNQVIKNGIDTNVFYARDSSAVRARLGIPKTTFLILFGGATPGESERKGLPHFLSMMRAFDSDRERSKDMAVLLFGRAEDFQPPLENIPVFRTGHVSDPQGMAELYSSADVFVTPAVQENLANTVLESLVCETPVVAFDIGGMPDMIEHLETGYLARPFELEDLSQGVLSFKDRGPEEISATFRKYREQHKLYSIQTQVRNYKNLYEDILAGKVSFD